jgi:broad specificity phosphatase PhoE
MLILARHGNTFERGETPRMVGAHEDPPLTAEGREQAHQLGRALKEAGVRLDCVRAGPLRRTLVHAQIAAADAGYARNVVVDPALRELDFGSWSGLSDEQVAQSFGHAAIYAWRRDGRRPENNDWAPTEAAVRAGLGKLQAEIQGTTLCVTSNGVLRYAMEYDAEAYAERGINGGFRVRTGCICVFRRTLKGLKLVLWNEKPDAAALRALIQGA